MADEPSIGDYIHEMVMDATSLLDGLNEAAQQNAQGNEQAACEAIAVSHYKLDALAEERDGLLGRFKARGVVPGR